MGFLTTIEDSLQTWADNVLNPPVLSCILFIPEDVFPTDDYSVTIGTTVFTVTATETDTKEDIFDALETAINAGTLAVTATASSTQLGIVSDDSITTFKIRCSDTMAFNPPLVPVIWMHQNGPIPKISYVTLHIMQSDRYGLPYKSLVTPEFDVHGALIPGTDVQDIVREKKFTLSIQGYGTKSDDYLETLLASLDLQAVQDYFDTQGLSSIDDTPVKDISAILDMQAEVRSVFEVTFLTSLLVTDQVGYMDKVEYSGEYLPPE